MRDGDQQKGNIFKRICIRRIDPEMNNDLFSLMLQRQAYINQCDEQLRYTVLSVTKGSASRIT